ncbi:homeodomain-interacting protein kinase 3-like isoform X2 [Mugil cephalus]|uniref:homeodomain-interacting protein kinase 3-like isoform X2 n=1 Tax=Mugil cephalus TaxID=48193 RepID=UPI001FB64C85|nr:homeodomain-interacting protein kinase 3-like isoform X2 [Mugil cephalus]
MIFHQKINVLDHLRLKPWDLMFSAYQFCGYIYTSCFNQVAECMNMYTRKTVAVKILRKRASDSQEPRELTVLKQMERLSPVNIVHFFEDFNYKGHTCLAFEKLDMRLHDLLQKRRDKPLSLAEIKPITQQLLNALEFLKDAGVIHTNIKPHNIMLVNHKDQPFRVKLTGFGRAIQIADIKRHAVTQVFGYRSPDVILGLPVSASTDMWSLGAVVATMYLGSPPFPHRCPYYLMKTLVETLGQPEDALLNEGTSSLLYFSCDRSDSGNCAWRFKTPEEHRAATGYPPLIYRGKYIKVDSIQDLTKVNPDLNPCEDRLTFASLLSMMLHMNPYNRITPSEALTHHFLTRHHFFETADDAPCNAPTETTGGPPDITSSEAPCEAPAATVGDAPSVALAESASEVPGKAPTETTNEATGEAAGEVTGEAPCEAPAETTGGAPDITSFEAPSEAPTKNTGNATDITSADPSEASPATVNDAPGVTLTEAAGEAPAKAPTETTSDAPTTSGAPCEAPTGVTLAEGASEAPCEAPTETTSDAPDITSNGTPCEAPTENTDGATGESAGEVTGDALCEAETEAATEETCDTNGETLNEVTGNTNTRRTLEKRIREFANRLSKVHCCCCTANAVE